MLTGEHDTSEAVQRLQYHHQLLALGINPQNGTYPALLAGAAVRGSDLDVGQNGHAGAAHIALKMENPLDGPAEQGAQLQTLGPHPVFMSPFYHPGPHFNYYFQPHPNFMAHGPPGYFPRRAFREEALPALPRPSHVVPSALMVSAKEEPPFDISGNSRFANAIVKPAKSSYGKLVFHTKPEPFGNLNTWSQYELLESRRIIEFRKVRVYGDAVHLDCRPIRPHEYSEDKMTISCIYWMPSECEGDMPAYMGRCVFTSVDVIALLARISGRAFPIKEKNRIRRNLEGCGPQTVKKEGDTTIFFNQLMRYEHPRTRNIEKDIKVFKWENVSKAMKTIFQRYVGSKTPSALAVDEKPKAREELELSELSQDTQGMDPRMGVGEFGMEVFEGYSHGMIPGDFSVSPQRLQL